MVMMLSVLGSVSVVQAQEWKAGDNVTVSKNGNVITVKGNGDMKNYSLNDLPAWTNDIDTTKIIIDDGVTSIGDFAFSNFMSVKDVTIADTVKYIGQRAFSGCFMLKTINIPASVEVIGDYALSTTVGDASNLEKITVSDGNKNFTIENDILYNITKTILYKVPSKLNIEKLDVISSVVSIKPEAVISCKSLKEVNLPVNVISVGANAFTDCKNLQKVVVQNGECDLALASIPDNKGLELYGYKDTNVELYAQRNGCSNITFVPLDECTTHKWDGGQVTKPATCTSTGIKTYTCTVCKATKTEEIAKTAHKVVIDEAVEATCTKTGLTEGKHCSVCETVIEKQEVIPKTAHKYDDGQVTKSATCTSTGVKTYTCTVCKATKTETIAKKAHSYKNYVTKATTSKNGSIVNKCSICGAKKSTSTVYKIKSVILTTSTGSVFTSTYYNGKVKTPGVTVKDSKGKTLKKGTDYTVSYESGRKNVGRYAVKVTFKGNYSGSKTLYFNVIPKNVSGIKKLTARSKGFTVSWNPQKTQVTGYQIQYSTASNFKNAKTITMGKSSYSAKKVTGRMAKKRYYVRIRTYKTVKFNGKNYNIYSPWCAKKSVVTKK